MNVIFVSIYRFFSKRKTILFTLLSLFFIFSAYHIQNRLFLNEDVAKVIPLDQEMKKVNSSYSNTRFSDQIIFMIHAPNPSTETLIEYADQVYDSLNLLDSQLIRRIRYTLEDSLVNGLYDFYLEQLPFFLDSIDYETIQQSIDSSEIINKISLVYKNLISPTGLVFKDKLLKDPLHIGLNAVRKLQDFQLEGNFELVENRIMSKDHQHLLLFVEPAATVGNTGANKKLIESLDQLVLHFNKTNPNLKVEYFGSAAVSVANAQQIKKDIFFTVGIAVVILLVFFAAFFRSLLSPIMIFIPVLIGATTALTTLVWLKPDGISAISLGVGAILLGICVDYSLHFYTHFRKENSLKGTLKDISTATTISGLTTFSAFLCLLWMSSEAMRDLGLFAAIAVLASALAALLILPHLLKPKKEPVKSNTFLDRLAAVELHRNKFLIALVLLLSLLFIPFVQKVQFEEDLNSINFTTQSLQKTDSTLQALSGESMRNTYLMVSDSNPDAALSKNERLYSVLLNLAEQGDLQRISSVVGHLPSQKTQKQKLDQWNLFWTKEQKDLLRQRMLTAGNALNFKAHSFQDFYALLDKDYRLLPADAFDPLKKSIFNDYYNYKDGQHHYITILKIAEDKKAVVYQKLSRLENVQLFDKQLLTNTFAAAIKKDFNSLSKWSFLIVFLILLIAYGRIELAILTTIPIMISWEWTLALMYFLNIKFNLVNIIVCTFIFGLGVDYSVFITKGLLQASQSGTQKLSVYKTSILLSVLTTICGMGVMIFAQHPALYSIASLSIIGLGSIVLICFILQPVLIQYLIVGRTQKGLPPYTLGSFLSTIIAYLYFVSGSLILTLIAAILTLTPFRKKTKKHLLHRLLQLSSRGLIKMMFNVRKRYIDLHLFDIRKPSMIIANHQSFLDIILILALHPKIVLMTNNWVWNSPIFGRIVRFADFYPADAGAENSIDPLRSIVEKGYSIMVFPEGTRSTSGQLGRFKKGAFYIAEKLQLDIIPIVFHGTGDCIQKKDFMVRQTTVAIKILPRIVHSDRAWGTDYKSRCKSIALHFKKAYASLASENKSPELVGRSIIKSYLYKSPVLEWYVRIKLKLEDNYRPFLKLIPQKSKIYDIGCGYGMLSYMLSCLSSDRNIIGIDYDSEKIKVAQKSYLKNPQINFYQDDALNVELEPCDVIILSDVLHYLPKEKQNDFIVNCLSKINPEGIMIIRDGDRDLKERHKGTRWTERFSTKIIGFNQTPYGELSYISGTQLEKIASTQGFKVDKLDLTKKTSNIIFVLKHAQKT